LVVAVVDKIVLVAFVVVAFARDVNFEKVLGIVHSHFGADKNYLDALELFVALHDVNSDDVEEDNNFAVAVDD
jgi:uncharacterized membrane protein